MKIKHVTSRIAGLTSGAVSYPEPGRQLAADLLSAHDEQLALLQSLGSPVRQLAAGPWQTARLRLRETLLPDRPAEHVTAALERAAGQLRDALPLQPPASFERAQVLADLAIVQRFLGDDQQAARSACGAYWLARQAMGALLHGESGGDLPTGPEELARLSLAGTVYDTIEWAAAAIGDPAAGRVVRVCDGQARFSFGGGRVTWASDGDLDFAYIAYFQLLVERARDAEAVGPGPTTSQRVLWLRFRDQQQIEHPRHPPLPPEALLADGRVALRELQLLASTGRL